MAREIESTVFLHKNPRATMDGVRSTGDETVTTGNEGDASRGRDAASVLLCYAPDCEQDRALLDRLMEHLALLRRQGRIRAWHDGMLMPGDEREAEVRKRLDEAQVILLLVSASFVASDTCYERLAAHAMERRAAGTARVIPVVLRPCEWRSAPFGALAALPSDGRAIAQFEDIDVAFTEVAKGLRAALETLPPARMLAASSVPAARRRRTIAVGAITVVALAGVGFGAFALRARGGDSAALQPAPPMLPKVSGSAPPSSTSVSTAPTSASALPSKSAAAGAVAPESSALTATSNAVPSTSAAAVAVSTRKAQNTTSAAPAVPVDAAPSAAVSAPSKAPLEGSTGVRVGSVKTGNESPVAIGNGAKRVGVDKVETGDKSPVTIGNQ